MSLIELEDYIVVESTESLAGSTQFSMNLHDNDCVYPVDSIGIIEGSVIMNGIEVIGAICEIYSNRTGKIITTQTTKENGYYKFEFLDENDTYYLIVKEPSGLWEYRIKSRLVPYVEE